MDKTKRIILHIESSTSYGRGFLRGIARYSRIHGPWSFYSESGDLERSLPKLEEWKPHGMIARATTKNAGALARIKIPMIAVDAASTEIPGFPNVNVDNAKVGVMAATHFVERGFKYLAYLGFDQYFWSHVRGEYFGGTGKEHDAMTYFFHRPKIRGRLSWEVEMQAIGEWIKTLPKPVGLLAANDARARHAVEACIMADVRIPDDVAVLGVDNDEVVCGLANPQISSVDLNTERGGYETAALLDRIVSGAERCAQQELIVEPVGIVTRRSTDVLAVEDAEMAEIMAYIRENSKGPLVVKEIIERMAMSRRTLEQRFIETFGRSIHKEIRRARVDHVARMLVETDMPVLLIAVELGYPSPKHVARYFKQEKGMTPREYRRRYGK